MFNLIINFCLFVFIFYAVGSSAMTILFGLKRKKRAYSQGRAVRRRKAKVIKLNARTTKRPLREKPQRFFVLKGFFAGACTLLQFGHIRRGGLQCPSASGRQCFISAPTFLWTEMFWADTHVRP